MDKQIIAKNIKTYREINNMYQEELAKKLGVTDKAVSAWETGKAQPRIGTVAKICEIFHCQITDITEEHKEYDYLKKAPMIPEDTDIDITEDDVRLIRLYHALGHSQKSKLLEYAIALIMGERKD